MKRYRQTRRVCLPPSDTHNRPASNGKRDTSRLWSAAIDYNKRKYVVFHFLRSSYPTSTNKGFLLRQVFRLVSRFSAFPSARTVASWRALVRNLRQRGLHRSCTCFPFNPLHANMNGTTRGFQGHSQKRLQSYNFFLNYTRKNAVF